MFFTSPDKVPLEYIYSYIINSKKEREIQEIFKSAYRKASPLLYYNSYSIKRIDGKNTVRTDGIIEYYSEEFHFKMLQEIKFNDIPMREHLAQLLMYDWIESCKNPRSRFRCYFLINRRYFTYVYDHEILDLKKELILPFSKADRTPCDIHKSYNVMDTIYDTEKIPFHSIKIDKYFNLKEIMNTICKEVIKEILDNHSVDNIFLKT